MSLFPRAAAVAGLAALAACSQAPEEPAAVTEGAWTVDSDASELSFVSIKAGDIAEVNSFETVSGSVSADGAAAIEIDLASVDTKIDIRDQRLRDILFEVADNPTATVNASLNPETLSALKVGESAAQTFDGTLGLKGLEAPIQANVTVTRVGPDRVLVVSNEPVIVEADRFELVDGLAQLQEIAGLPSITPVVPVSFSLAFER